MEAAKAVQEKIEEEMKKRKERMEAWRLRIQKEEDEQAKLKSEDGGDNEGEEGGDDTNADAGESKRKGWSLEDDDEDEETDVVPMEEETADANKTGGEERKVVVVEVELEEEMDEDVDPLDRFMVGVQQEVKEINTAFQKKVGTQFGTGNNIHNR